MKEHHLLLLTGSATPGFEREPIHVEPLGGSRYRVMYTPGLVYGIAAGDEIEAAESEGTFRVLERGGNVAVRVLSEEPLGELPEILAAEVSHQLGGTLDGRLNRGAAFTVPIKVGFSRIESLLASFVSKHPGTLWEYGNIYDENNQPLDWWKEFNV
jgi:hypothetical protein